MRKLITLFFLCTALFAQAQNDYYWVGGAGGWLDSTMVNGTAYMTHWAKDENGTGVYTRAEFSTHSQTSGGEDVFTQNDMDGTVYFGSNSGFVDGDSVFVKLPSQEINMESLDVSNLDVSVNLVAIDYIGNFGWDYEIHVTSSTTLSPLLNFVNFETGTWDGLYFDLDGGTDVNFTQNEANLSSMELAVSASSAPSNTFHLNDSLNCKKLILDGGSYAFNDQPIVAEDFEISDLTEPISLSSSHLEILDDFQIRSSSFALDGSNSSIDLLGSDVLFLGRGNVFEKVEVMNEKADVEFDRGGIFESLTLRGRVQMEDDNTITNLTVMPGTRLEVEAQSTQTITGSISMIGTSASAIELYSTTQGDHAFLSVDANATVDAEYLVVQDIDASVGTAIEADYSYDLGNNNGWNFINSVVSTDFYWVGGTSNNWSDGGNWATTSGGTTLHSAPPFNVADVYFDANSFDAPGTINITEDIYFNTLDMSGLDEEVNFDSGTSKNGTVIDNHSASMFGGLLVLSDKLTLDSLDLAIESNTDDVAVTSANTEWYDVNLQNGESVTTTFMDSFSCANDFKLTSGNLDLNDQEFSIFDNFTSTSPGNLTLGASNVYCKQWQIQNTILDAETSTISFQGSQTTRSFLSSSGLSYHLVTFTEESGEYDGGGLVQGLNTFEFLTLEPGSAVFIEDGVTVTDTFTADGDGTSEGFVSIEGLDGAFISSQANDVTVEYVILKNIDADTNTGVSYAANYTFDLGGNDGWDIPTPITNDFYWVGGISENWDDAGNWATSSGGSSIHPIAPDGPSANIFFDENSFSSDGQTVKLNSSLEFGSMTWEHVDQQVTFDGTATSAFTGHDDVTFSDQVTPLEVNLTLDASEDAITLETADISFEAITIDGDGQNEVTVTGILETEMLSIKQDGRLITNQDVVLEDHAFADGSYWHMGASVVSTLGNDWDAGGLTIDPSSTATIELHNTGGNLQFFGNSNPYYIVTIKADTVIFRDDNSFLNLLDLQEVGVVMIENNWIAPSAGALVHPEEWVITSDDCAFTSNNVAYPKVRVLEGSTASFLGINAFGFLKADQGSTLVFEAGSSVEIENLDMVGSSTAPIYLHSTQTGSQATLQFAANPLVQFAVIQDMEVSIADSEYLVTTLFSEDGGNNDGWDFVTTTATYSPIGVNVLEEDELTVTFSRPVVLDNDPPSFYIFRVVEDGPDPTAALIGNDQITISEDGLTASIDIQDADFKETEDLFYVYYGTSVFIDEEFSVETDGLLNALEWTFFIEFPKASATSYSPFAEELIDLANPTLSVTFDRPVDVSAGELSVYLVSDDSQVATFSGSDLDVNGNVVSATLSNVSNLEDGVYYALFSDFTELTYGKTVDQIDKSVWRFTVEQPLSLEDDHRVTIYPNPTTGTIIFNTKEILIQQVELMDQEGKVLHRAKENTLDLSPYPDGIYYLRISHSEGEIEQRIIKRSK